MNRYEFIQKLKTDSGKNYRKNVIYPELPLSDNDYYIITSVGDRYDLLAQQFYGDHTLWWVIASANNSEQASLTIPPGIQLRIPSGVDRIKELFTKVNK